MDFLGTPFLWAIIALVIVILAIVGFIVSRLKVVGVSEALLISGSTKEKAKVKVIPAGGRAFILPIIQSYTLIPLSQFSIPLGLPSVDKDLIPIQVGATAIIKIGSDEESIRAAAERFSSYKNVEEGIKKNITETLIGSLRSVVSSMTVKALLTERSELGTKVQEIAASEIKNMGLVIDSLTVNEITDDNDLINDLGKPKAENVTRDARIAKANANKEANDVEIDAQLAIAQRQKDLDIRKAELQSETDKALAESNAAGPKEKAEQLRLISEVETHATEKRAALRDKELDIEVRRPADARKYEITANAEADKAKEIAGAEAIAESTKIQGFAEADAIRAKGSAEAEAIQAKGLAEAEAMDKKAEAFKKYNQAAVLQLVIDKLPEIAHELAAPMSNIKDLTVLSTEGAGALPKTVANNFGQLDKIVQNFTGGSSISDLLGGIISDSTLVDNEDEMFEPEVKNVIENKVVLPNLEKDSE